MSTRIVSNSFEDIFGNVTSFYKANAGDKITLTTEIEATIAVTEDISNNISFNWIDGELLLNGGKSWITEGFKVGDTASILAYNQDGTINTTIYITIDYLDNVRLSASGGLGTYFDDTNLTIRVLNTSRTFEDLEIYFNHIQNDVQAPSFDSLIDLEKTKIFFKNIDALAVSGTLNAELIGNQSGQYVISSVITRLADVGIYKKYSIETTFINAGILLKSSFDNGNCLKLCLGYNFYAESGNKNGISTLNYFDNANTGYFNQAYNNESSNSILTQGVSTIAYNQETTFDIIVNTSETEFSLGCSYISIDETYYKNKITSQIELSDLLNQQVLAVGTISSANGDFEIEVNTITTVGTIHTINVTFRPLTGFDTFIENRSQDDRKFLLWLKAGNVNHIVFEDNLTKVYESELPLNTSIFTLIRHDDNTTSSTQQTINKVNKEDDLAFYSEFSLTTNQTYLGVKASIVAYNSITLDEFELESVFFDFDNAQILSGQYLLNESINVSNNLPSSSNKKTAILTNTTGDATLYYPFVVRWEDWLSQTNANVSFYPNQNKDWLNYISGNWKVYCKISLDTDESIYTERLELPIYDYNSEPDITTTIEIYDENNNLVNALISGQIMRIKAIHNFVLSPDINSWGQITLESFEDQPRYLISTIIDADNNIPLKPITSTTASMTINTFDVTIECYLDTNLLTDTSYSISSKVFTDSVHDYVQFSNDDNVEFSNGDKLEWS